VTTVQWRLDHKGLSPLTGTTHPEPGVRPHMAVARAIQRELAVKCLAIHRIGGVRRRCGCERNRYVLVLGWKRNRRSVLLTTLILRDTN
jgi:hypothetical protein